MRVLVTFAVAPEFASWRRRHKFLRLPSLPAGLDLARCPVFRARIGETETLVALTGIGPVRARRAARYALQAAPDVCISSGLAGALKDGYTRGELLAAAQVTETRGKHVFRADSVLLDRAVASGARTVQRFLTNPAVVTSSSAKRELGAQGDAVEMESAGVLAAAAAAEIPAIAVRVISDDAGQDLPLDFNRVLTVKGKVRPVRLLSSIAAEPASLRGLLQLAGDSRRASTVLADFLDRYIPDLARHRGMFASVALAGRP
ncbi:MAG TPA: hypothetical protein VLW54_07790 [Candidatus Acidoferrales bacterium]|nr:hypothetical protein [Candidatus Acidoferrales bacterium]